MENIDLNKQFYKCPTNHTITEEWLSKCSLPNDQHHKLYICEDHFTELDFDMQYKRRTLKATAVPSQNLEGPQLLYKDIMKLKPILIQQVAENVQLKSKINRLNDMVNDINSEINLYDRRIKRRKISTAFIKRKWTKQDVRSDGRNLLSKVFSNAQINVLSGEDKVTWTDDDMAMAFSLRQLSSKECYLYLKNILNIPLPSLSCVQRWAASK